MGKLRWFLGVAVDLSKAVFVGAETFAIAAAAIYAASFWG